MRAVAEAERQAPEDIRDRVARGTVAICANVNHAGLRPAGVGEGLRVKVNANLGTSSDFPDIAPELEKLDVAVKAGADAVMDLSTGDHIDETRRAVIARSPVMVGTVPVYEAAVTAIRERGAVVDMTAEDLLLAIEKQAKDGADFMTLHCGLTRAAVERLRREGRLMDVVSRGGSFITGWMLRNEKENPLYERFDDILDICAKYDAAISLGDGLRPGCLADATDRAQITELVTLTDIAPGYDHITAAIGGAMAATSGADFLCYVTPAEHLALPTAQDVHDGVMAARIAAHAADVARGIPGAAAWDEAMAKARKNLDWEEQMRLAIDPALARKKRGNRRPEDSDACSMCGNYCAVKIVNRYLGGNGEP